MLYTSLRWEETRIMPSSDKKDLALGRVHYAKKERGCYVIDGEEGTLYKEKIHYHEICYHINDYSKSRYLHGN